MRDEIDRRLPNAADVAHLPTAEPLTLEEIRDRSVFFEMLGPIKAYLDEELVQNIHVNADGSIFVERFGLGVEESPARMLSRAREALLSYLANQKQGGSLDHLNSRLQADLPIYGSRVQAFADPIGNWQLTLRQHSRHLIPLDEYVSQGILSERHATCLDEALREEQNIGIAGSVNSGKTTFMNSLLDRKADFHGDQRALLIQDRVEIRADRFRNKICLMARVLQAHHESTGTMSRYTYEFHDALEDGLRCSQDFIVWGEVRDPYSAFGLTMACNTGTKGLLTTFHANSGVDTLYRIEDLLRLGGHTPVRRQVANVFNLIAFLERDRKTGRRRVTEVLKVNGVNGDNDYDIESL